MPGATALGLAALLAPAAPRAQGPCPGADDRPAHTPLSEVRAATLCVINQERAGAGLPPLRANRRLRAAAMSHAREMVHRDYFAHVSARGASLGGRVTVSGYASSRDRWAAGEALAWGTGARAAPREIVRGWMESPGHRAILLTARFRDAGLGVARGAPGARRGGTTFTLDLACRC